MDDIAELEESLAGMQEGPAKQAAQAQLDELRTKLVQLRMEQDLQQAHHWLL